MAPDQVAHHGIVHPLDHQRIGRALTEQRQRQGAIIRADRAVYHHGHGGKVGAERGEIHLTQGSHAHHHGLEQSRGVGTPQAIR